MVEALDAIESALIRLAGLKEPEVRERARQALKDAYRSLGRPQLTLSASTSRDLREAVRRIVTSYPQDPEHQSAVQEALLDVLDGLPVTEWRVKHRGQAQPPTSVPVGWNHR